jgi:hypothetical protein
MVSVSTAGGAPSSTSASNSDKSSPGEPVLIGAKLYFTKDQWLDRQKERKKGSLLSRQVAASAAWREEVSAAHAEVPGVVPLSSARLPGTTSATIVAVCPLGQGVPPAEAR